ncbi:trimethyllysine dioxygenase, mitochondrial [Boleophthalmus pectinirostris]|uniref:trimethyllysine dioxygenase, mitochondrial n=1 Tax=Boleophthalmus pectinirostris TaxID=150288 RepID=UPI00242C0D60|nr:trimethyllysine dioxygenase, mitochondrial [Boleophthalmus pectinirostris]XP_055004276.1 trimethyllysine dioxygenase, mitochondrial [Boleophthalmus pectinirostris]
MYSSIQKSLRVASKKAQLLKSIKTHVPRAYKTHAATVNLLDHCLELHYNGTSMHFNFVWLRDHCRSESSFNAKTNQRSLDSASIDLSIRPVSTKVEDGHLLLKWPDDHVTMYDLSWLSENSYEGKRISTVQPRVLWDSDTYNKANVSPAKWDKFMSCDIELKRFLQNYLLFGIAFVQDVPATVEATEAVTQRVSLIRETIYGRMWCFTSDFSRGDTAYSQLALDRHTDTSYLQEPCGIQVFHCLKHQGTGGRTLLVDGFNAAEKLRERSPDNFELLTQIPIKHDYVENTGEHRNYLRGIGPLLEVYPWNKELYMIRYNNYDRSVINTIPHNVVQSWYVAHRDLTTELRRPQNELWVKLNPGTVIFIDNWRVMHGRESFTGLRQLCGCYLTRDDVLSKARGFGLQT